MRFFHFCLLFFFSLFAYSDNSYVVNNDALGVRTILPGDDWSVLHQNSPQSQLSIYISPRQKSRFILMSFPAKTYENMQQRAAELESSSTSYQQIQLQDTKVNNIKAQRLIYKLHNSHVIEIGIPQAHTYTIVQLSTAIAAWQTPQQQQGWENVFLRLQVMPRKLFLRNLQNISLQKMQQAKQGVATTRHRVKIFVKNSYLQIEDHIELQTQQQNLTTFFLYVALGKISQVNFVQHPSRCNWKIGPSQYPGLQKLIIDNVTWNAQKRLHLQIKAQMAYQAPQGVKMCFPTTYTTKATYHYHIHTPKNLSVITSTYLPHKDINYQQQSSRYSPQYFSLFIGEKPYSKTLSSTTNLVVVNGDATVANRIHKKLLLAQKIWKKQLLSDVIVLVNNDFSNGNFLNLPTQDDINTLRFISQLARLFVTHLADNLQMGAVSYLTALYVKSQKGTSAYFEHLRKKITNYHEISVDKEYALADPLSIVHPQIIATKAPVIFDMLRVHLGNKKFFRLWHLIVNTDKYRNYPQIIHALHQYKAFANQWFLRAGYPHFTLNWSQNKAQVLVDIRQKMQQNPFTLSGKIYIVCREKTYTMPVKITQFHHKWFIVSEEKVQNVYFRYY